MKKQLSAYNISLLFWIAFSIIFSLGAIGFRVGTPGQPGPGLMPLLVGIFMFFVSLITFLRNFFYKKKPGGEESLRVSFKTLRKPILIYFSLLVYGLILIRVGYLISTFLLMGFLFKGIEPQKWWVALTLTILSMGISYLIFVVWLDCQVPAFPSWPT